MRCIQQEGSVMANRDVFDAPLSASDAAAVEHYGVALGNLITLSGDPLSQVKAALAIDRGLVMAHILKGMLFALSSEQSLLAPAKAAAWLPAFQASPSRTPSPSGCPRPHPAPATARTVTAIVTAIVIETVIVIATVIGAVTETTAGCRRRRRRRRSRQIPNFTRCAAAAAAAAAA
jgi:hypothetical protein